MAPSASGNGDSPVLSLQDLHYKHNSIFKKHNQFYSNSKTMSRKNFVLLRQVKVIIPYTWGAACANVTLHGVVIPCRCCGVVDTHNGLGVLGIPRGPLDAGGAQGSCE